MFSFLKDLNEYASKFIPTDFRGINFSSFQAKSPETAAAKAGVQVWVNELKANHIRPLIIYGPTGTGKTMLASCAWNEIAPQVGLRSSLQDIFDAGTADNIAWLHGGKLPDEIKNKDRSDGRTKEQVQYHYHTVYFVVLDDLDKCPASEAWANELLVLIDARLCQYRVPTIITMNCTPSDLCRRYGQTYGPPMVDRMERTGGVFIRTPKDPSVEQHKTGGKVAEKEDKAIQIEGFTPVNPVPAKPQPAPSKFDREGFLKSPEEKHKNTHSK